MDVPRQGDLQVSEDLSFQRREFAAERVGWALIALTVAASLLGLLGGSGPFATATAGDAASGVRAEYERLTHVQRPTSLRLEAVAGPDEREVGLEIGSGYLDRVTVAGVSPEPERLEATPDGVRYVFAAEPGSTLSVVLSIEADRPGSAHAEVRRGDRRVSFTQFAFP